MSPSSDPAVGAVSPDPTGDELAAIVAAVEVTWPRAVPVAAAVADAPTWRFSGRWWAKPIPSRRDRPWRS